MSESTSPRLGIIIAVAAVAGIVVTLLANSIMNNDSGSKEPGANAKNESQRIEALEAQIKALQGTIAGDNKNIRPAGASVSALDDSNGKVGQAVTEAEETKEDDEEKNPLLEFMKAIGDQESKGKVSGEVAKFTERLGLNASQQEQLSEILMTRTKEQQEAGILMLTGKASLADLLAADEDNFSALDAAMADLLSPEQLEEYTAYADDREAQRIEKKSNEDLDGLREIGGLTAEQKDAAFDVFIEINAAEKPGSLPEGTTVTQFNEFIDQAIDNRIDRLQPILSETQLGSYRERVNGFRTMIKALVSGGTDNP